MSGPRMVPMGRASAAFALIIGSTAACGGGNRPAQSASPTATSATEARAISPLDGGDDQSRCDYRGRPDREVSETAGPGAVQPNVRRVYQVVGTGDAQHKVLVCREVDTNLDGIKDVVRMYNDKGESLREEADSNYDGRMDTWITFSEGRIAKEELDTDFDGRPDVWKYYVDGKLSRIQRDTNRDGIADQWEFYTNGRLERIGVDVDHDQHVDRWDHDEQQRLAEEAEAAKAERMDGGAPESNDGDGGAQVDGAGTSSALSKGDAGGGVRGRKRRKK